MSPNTTNISKNQIKYEDIEPLCPLHLDLAFHFGDINYIDDTTRLWLEALGFKKTKDLSEFRSEFLSIRKFALALLNNKETNRQLRVEAWKNIRIAVNHWTQEEEIGTLFIAEETATPPTKIILSNENGIMFDATETGVRQGDQIKVLPKQEPAITIDDFNWKLNLYALKPITTIEAQETMEKTWRQ